MISPFSGNVLTLKREWDTVSFRGESFEICRHFYFDEATGATFSSGKELDEADALDTLNTRQVHNQYRSRHHIPFPEEIQKIREQYGLSAAKMSEVLDFGINTYRQYEQGVLPTPANAKLIRLAANPRYFRNFVEEKEEIFSPKAFDRVSERIRALMQPSELSGIVSYIWNHDMEANAFTGFVKPDLQKVANFVIYFADKLKPLKTRLNKLLFYADFLHYKRNGFAISGCNYRAIQLGPVPSHFSELFGLLEDQGFVQIEHEVLDRGVGERFIPGQKFDETLFTEEELKSMQKVVTQFGELSTTDLVELSHEEKAWLDNHESRDLINYQRYAFALNNSD